ncbi:MAG: site-specific integrase [Deltaproteobacteria bacterium]|jgi:integrase
MAQPWVKAKLQGIRYREHASRKHGLQLDRYFAIRYRVGGKEKEESLGWASQGWTVTKASETLAELKRNARTGEGEKTLSDKRAAADAAKKAAETERLRVDTEKSAAEHAESERIRVEFETEFNSVFKKYCESKADKKSLHDEQTLIRLWVQPIVGLKRLGEITPFDIERIKRDLQKASRAIRTIEYTFAVIRQVYNYAKDRNIYDGESPTKRVKLQKFDNKRIRFLSPDEAGALLDEIKKHSLQSYRMSLLSLYTGLRLGEICKLTWDCIDFQNKRVLIIAPKNGEDRTVFMVPIVHQMFNEMEPGDHNSLVFHSKTNDKIIFVSKTFNRAVDHLGLNAGITDRKKKVVFHTLRHSCASQLAMSGADLPTIQNVLGHKTLAMTERYSHLSNEHIENALNRLQDRMNPVKSNVIPMTGRAG